MRSASLGGGASENDGGSALSESWLRKERTARVLISAHTGRRRILKSAGVLLLAALVSLGGLPALARPSSAQTAAASSRAVIRPRITPTTSSSLLVLYWVATAPKGDTVDAVELNLETEAGTTVFRGRVPPSSGFVTPPLAQGKYKWSARARSKERGWGSWCSQRELVVTSPASSPTACAVRAHGLAKGGVISLTAPVTLSWSLSGQDGQTLKNETAQIHFSYDGKAWSLLGSTPVTSDTMRIVVRPTRRTYYRIGFAGTSDNSYSLSSRVLAYPRVTLSKPRKPAGRVVRNRTFTTTGILKPTHKTGSRCVKVYCYLWERNKWKLRKTVWATAGPGKGYTTYRASISLPTRGWWGLKAVHPQDSMHAYTGPTAITTRDLFFVN